MNNKIQSIVFPYDGLCSENDLYFRVDDYPIYINNEGRMKFSSSARASFDTYFNGLTINAWKENCTIDDLSLSLEGQGKFLLRIGLHRLGHATRYLLTKEVELEKFDSVINPVTEWPALDAGILFFELTALSDAAELKSASWVTSTEPANDVKLGIVVTHFNRKEYVIPAIKRINDQLLKDESYAGRIDLIVVDNSQNISTDESEGAVIIPNKNLGGSGGFTRGFMHLSESDYTHCLFMDDDASCEIESIRRAYNILSYSSSEKTAGAGALLRDIEPYRLFEKGAKFDGMCRPLKSGLDMRSVNDLILAEVCDQKPDYGGWWFFAFKISTVSKLAFPFFVRGDDIMFSMVNDFNIITMNGISCWGEDFALKSGPLPIYLDVRNHLVQQMTHLDSSLFEILKTGLKFFFSSAFSYNYATAKAVTEAIKDVVKGPGFWVDNIDTSEIRKKIGSLQPEEKLARINRSDYSVVYASPFENKGRRILRMITLNGFLLPGFLMKDQVVFQHKSFRGSFREVFRYKHVLYEYEPSGKGYVASYNRKLFFHALLDFGKALLALSFKHKALKKEYKRGVEDLTSREFWNRVYSGDK